MTPRAVIFDCDGVLVDSEPAAFDLLAEDLAAHGLPLPRAEMERIFIGGTIAGVHVKARSLGATLPDGSKILYNGYVSFNETPSMTKNQLMAVTATFSLQSRPVRYAS